MSHSNTEKLNSWFVAVVTFGLWAVSIDFFFTRFVLQDGSSTEAARIGHFIRENGSEIPILGDSTAQDDYIPEILGDNYFNCGIRGASDDVVNALLEIEVKKRKQTPILLGLCAGIENMHSVDLHSYAAYARRPEIRQMLDRFGQMSWRYWVPGLRYFDCYDGYLKDYLLTHYTAKMKNVRGYTIREFGSFNHRIMDKRIKERLKAGYGFHSSPDQERRFCDIIKSTPLRTFIIVYSPQHSSCFADFKDREGYERHLEKLRSFPNVVLLDWSQMEFPDDFYADTTHLNHKGASEFSRRLASQLKYIQAAASSKDFTKVPSR